MSVGNVDAAIERIRQRDPDAAPLVEAVADGLIAGEGTDAVHQAAVQQYLWVDVPSAWPDDAWDGIVTGAAVLFDELGLHRYAAIARSPRTAEVLGAWRDSGRAGRKAFLAAQRASGVEPPDTGALVWGGVFGPDEGRARTAVERALERAIDAGELVPGARGWKVAAGAVTARALGADLDHPPGQSLLSLVTTERAEAWVGDAQAAVLRRWREAAVRRILGPIDPPADVATVVAPVRWLLERASVGVDLTPSGYIGRTLVVEAADRFGWRSGDKPPRSEADLHQLVELRGAVTDLRLLRRTGRTLLATTRGAGLVGDDVALWRELSGTLGGTTAFEQLVGEMVGHRLLDGPVIDDEIVGTIGPILTSLGWRTAEGPLTSAEVESATWDRWRWWRVLGLLERTSARWDRAAQRQVGHTTTTLTPAGRATVLAFLRQVALRPRDHVVS